MAYYQTEHGQTASVDFEGDIELETSDGDIYLTREDLAKMIRMIDGREAT